MLTLVHIRAHILTSASLLFLLLVDTPDCLADIDKDLLKSLYESLLKGDQNPTDVAEEDCVKQLNSTISQLLVQAANNSRTGKLWAQYIQQVALMRLFIRAERTGDWDLHLYCIMEMIPHFHPAGHLHYAKFCTVISAADGSPSRVNASSRICIVHTERLFSLYGVLTSFGAETFPIRQLNKF